MSAISESVELINRITHLKPKGRKIPFEINTVLYEFDIRKEAIRLRARTNEDSEWQEVRVMPHATLHSYLRGFFGMGIVTQNGEIVNKETQDKYAEKRQKNEEQTKKREKRTRTKTESKKRASYGLGEPVDKKTQKVAIKEFDDSMKMTKVLRELVLKNFDNDACINCIKSIYGEDIIEQDVNKVRRQLRRKGLWT